MKLYAQHGFADGNKIATALEEEIISGVVFGAKDIRPDKLEEKLADAEANYPSTIRLLDPQFYVSLLASNPNVRLGSLAEYPYFGSVRRSQLEASERVVECLASGFDYQQQLPLSGIIAPNILISRSLDSIEAVIAKNFIRRTGEVFARTGDNRPVYATLAISGQALIDKGELQLFLNDITLLDTPPRGFYVLVSASRSEARSEVFNADVIAGWLLLNYSLKMNGFEVINGYSDILSPLLAAVGADVGCSGWFNTLRIFSLDRFAPAATGGRLPVQRYLSNRLFNRLTFIELNALRGMFPQLVNGLSHDADYAAGEPQRNREVLQSWEALSGLIATATPGEVEENLERCSELLNQADELYTNIAATGFSLDVKSSGEHIESLQEGIDLFRELAEL